MKKYQKILQQACLMSLFTIVSVVSMIYINNITKNKIILHKEKEKEILLEQVISSKMYNEFEKKTYKVTNILLGDDKSHNLWLLSKDKIAEAAIVETTAPDGYSGRINMLVAAYFNGKIIGVRVLSHKETPGIGDKIELSISNWIKQFTDMYVLSLEDTNFSLKKFGGKIEQFTGATITPQSVTNAVKRTVMFIKKIPLILNQLNKDMNEY